MTRYRIYEVWEVQHPKETDHDFYESSISPTFAHEASAEAWLNDYLKEAYETRGRRLDEIIETHEHELMKLRAVVPPAPPPPGKRGRLTTYDRIEWREKALVNMRRYKEWLDKATIEEWRTESATRARAEGYYLDQWIHELEVRELWFELADGELSDLVPVSGDLT